MTDAELAEEELKLAEIYEIEREATALIARLAKGRHLTIAHAGAENALFRISAERRIIAGRVMAAKQADPADLA